MVQDKDAPLIAPATVNRSTTEVLKKLFTRARNVWGIRFNQMPNWKEHMLREPEERVRELRDGEEQRIVQAMRDDYSPLIEFARMTGLRAAEVRTLEWSHVNWGTRQIVRLGKGGSGYRHRLPMNCGSCFGRCRGTTSDTSSRTSASGPSCPT